MVTLRDVANKCGVSISTVSRTLSNPKSVREDKRIKVLQTVNELNYQTNDIAKSLRKGKTNTIALIIPNIILPVFPVVTTGVQAFAKEHGFTVILSNTDDDAEQQKEIIEKLRKRMVDGFIIIPAENSGTHLKQLKKQNVPIVQVLRRMDPSIDAVIVDNFKGGYNATQYLIDKGHKEIALLNGAKMYFYKGRFEGYLQALKDNNLLINNPLIKHDANGVDGGYHKMQQLLREGYHFTAVFATSDLCAIGAIKAITQAGLRVPEDISILGFDNLDIGSMFIPGLTTIAHPALEMGYSASQRLIKIIQEGRILEPETIVMKTKILERETVANKI
ncbi:MAG: hypothetical protein JM58_15630 [Peptococcaceae bacterium BICA1-8]|nr:MAG: hypothetical protein JM58_15630 [Peptococcaceae bacterium BICA1-8]